MGAGAAAAVLAGALALAASGAGNAAAAPEGPAHYPVARHFAGLAPVGVLFRVGGGLDHFCTASVVASPAENLVLTAAHCISGTGTNIVFVPGYRNGRRPYGTWTVTAAYVDLRWDADHDPRFDYALLTVAKLRIHGRLRELQKVVGADTLVDGHGYRSKTLVPGYARGFDDTPLRCVNVTHPYVRPRDPPREVFPEFDCHGYVSGTSGSPWIIDFRPAKGTGDVDGVIGGLREGGCFEYTSFTSYFGSAAIRLYHRAIAGEPGDVVVPAKGSGC